jgi:hypothetical protein
MTRFILSFLQYLFITATDSVHDLKVIRVLIKSQSNYSVAIFRVFLLSIPKHSKSFSVKLRFKQVTHGIIFLHFLELLTLWVLTKVIQQICRVKMDPRTFPNAFGNIHLLHIHGLIQKYYSGNFHLWELF